MNVPTQHRAQRWLCETATVLRHAQLMVQCCEAVVRVLPERQARLYFAILLPQDELQFLRVRSAKREIMVSARRLPVSSAFYTCETILSCHMKVAGISVSTFLPVQPPRLYRLGMLDALDGTLSWLCPPCVQNGALELCNSQKTVHLQGATMS